MFNALISRLMQSGGQRAPLAVIAIPKGASERPATAARIAAITEQLTLAGITEVIATELSGGRVPEFPGVRSLRADAVAKRCSRHTTVLVRSDQYHVSHEWLADLVRRTVERGVSHTHENYSTPLLGHLRLTCAFTVIHATAAGRILDLVAREAADAVVLAPVFQQERIALETVAVKADNIFTFYRQAALLDKPISFVVETNSSCNYHCIMCPYHGGRQSMKPTYLKPGTYVDMPIETFRKVVDEIAALPRPYEEDPPVLISPYRRGEFLLYPHWREALSYIKAKPGIKAYFSSNGSMWSDDDVEFVLDIGLDQLQISIEGHDLETHRRIRLNNEFESVANTIRRIMRRREERGLKVPYLQIAHTVNERNYSIVDEYVKFWLTKVDALYIGPENYADDENANKRYKTQFSPVSPRPAADRPPCAMVKDNVWVDAEGTVILCIGSKQTIIGDVNKSSLHDILRSPVRLEVLEKHYKGVYDDGVCATCEQWYSAYGETTEATDYSAFLSPDTQYYRNKQALDLTW